jgi:hypothetical protein
MWLLSKIDYEVITKLLLFAQISKADSIKIHTKLGYYDSYKLENTNITIDNIKLQKYSEGDNFLPSHNATIWNKQYLIDNNIIVEVKTQIIKIISKNGDVEHTLIISENTPETEVSHMFDPDRHVGLFWCDKNFESGCINNIYSENLCDIGGDYELSNVRFMLVELEYENNKYRIELKNETYNYYIVNNCLNQIFFKYYLKNILNVPINEDNFHYTVTIIDSRIQMFTLLPDQYIIINKIDYTVHPIKHNESTQNNVLPISQSNTIIDDQHSNSDTDKSDDFVKLDGEY